MKTYYLILLFLQSAVLSSCLGGSHYYRDRVEPFLNELKPNYKPQVYDGVKEPNEIPDLEEDKKTLDGIDSNKDGVRDDLEIFINRNFHTWVERVNLKNEVRRAPKFFQNYKKMSVDEFIVHDSNGSYDQKCVLSGLALLGLEQSPELLKYRASEALYNTTERSAANSFKYQESAGRAYGDGYGDKKILEKCSEEINKHLLNKEGK